MAANLPSLTTLLALRLAQPVDAAALRRARLHLLDWLACVAGARQSPTATIARAAEPDPLTRAALAGNVLEMDDVDRQGRLHPGPVIWPAALSASRDERGTMASLLTGAVRGYEAMIAVGRTFDDRHYGFWHNTATAGGFGAAAAAASIYELDTPALAAALGNAGSIAGGFWQMRHEPVMTKALHVAHSALAGVWVARLARGGFTGPARILEGEQGLFAATMVAPRLDDFPGDGRWRIGEVSFKPYPACRHVHAAIDVALTLGDALGTGPIRVETYRDALTFCDRPDPVTELDAKFSLQHAVAVVAVRGVPTLADFDPSVITDPAVAAARARVTVGEAPEFTAAYPAHFGARIHAGNRHATAHDALGDPERPIGEAAIIAKLRDLADWGGLTASDAGLAVELTLEAPDEQGTDRLIRLIERWTR